ncbi:cytochrome P450 [Actinokineospora soli]
MSVHVVEKSSPVGWFDALLRRTPLRPGELSVPPKGLKPVVGDRGLPFLGLGLHTVRYGPEFLLELMRRHGPVSWWQAFGRKIVAVSGPEAVQAVLANRDKAFASGWPAVIGPWFDGGLLAMDGVEHLADRRVLRAAYTPEALDGYLRAMSEDTAGCLDKWPAGRPVRVVDAVRALSGEITTRAFLGVPYDPSGREVMTAVEKCIRAETVLTRLPLPGTAWHSAHRARRLLLDYLRAALPAARDRDAEDFLSVLSRVEGISATQAAQHMLFTLIASHDTTTAATIAAVYFLGAHPEWQDRARTDPDAVELVVKESIRLVSPSPILMRVAVRETEVLGHHIPAGQLVSVCTAVNQLLPELWPDPQRFDPSRFARGEDGVHRLAWAPFGSGAHKCIGLHLGMLKVTATLSELLRRFTWSYPPDYRAVWRFSSLPAPADGLPTTFTAR